MSSLLFRFSLSFIYLLSSILQQHFLPASQYPDVLCDILSDVFLLPEKPVSHFAFPVCTIKSICFHIKKSFLHLYHLLKIGHVSPKLLFCLRYSERFESFLSHDKSAKAFSFNQTDCLPVEQKIQAQIYAVLFRSKLTMRLLNS